MVDDVHLSNRFGELLHALAASLRNRVVQMTASEQPSGSITPNTLASHRQYAQSFEGDTNNQMMVCGPGSYHELSMGRMGLGDHSIADPEYDNCQAGSTSATAAGTPAYYAMNPASGLIDQVQNDPLINFAGLGPNQLGWSGGQDFFDMLGPLLDVQYEQYK